MFNFLDDYDDKVIRKKEFRKNYKMCYRIAHRKFIRSNPSNGQTIDVVDMMQRNRDRFNHGFSLNQE